MTISTAGDGERDLLVSYISEVPVWKSTIASSFRAMASHSCRAGPLSTTQSEKTGRTWNCH